MGGKNEKLVLAGLIVLPAAYVTWLLFCPFTKLMLVPIASLVAVLIYRFHHADAFFRRMAWASFGIAAASATLPTLRLSLEAREFKAGFVMEPGSAAVTIVALLATVGFAVLESRRRREKEVPPSTPAPSAGKTMNINGGNFDNSNFFAGDQHIHNDKSSSQSLDAVEKLVDNGLLDASTQALEAIEKRDWASMAAVEKFRHRKMQGRVLLKRGQDGAAADRFLAAVDFTPNDEKAQVLRATAYMIRGELDLAHKLSGELVEKYPNLIEAKGVWINSAPKTKLADELLAKPWEGLAPEVASALADRLIAENRVAEAVNVLQKVNSPGVKLDYWMTYSIALLKLHEEQQANGSVSDDMLDEALKALGAAYKLCAGEGQKKIRVQILLNTEYAHRVRGDVDEEWRALQTAYEIDPSHHEVRVRMAKVLTERGKLDDAIKMFEALLGDGPPYVPFLLGAALAKRDNGDDLERARALFEAAAASAIDPLLKLDCAEALVTIARRRQQWDDALVACARHAEVLGAFRKGELEATIYIERGDTASAQRILAELQRHGAAESDSDRQALGVLFHRAGDNERAFSVLEKVAPDDGLGPPTVALLNAAQETGRDEFTIRFCRRLRANGVNRSSVVDAEAVALAKRDEIAAAIAVVEQALALQEDPYLRLRMSTLGIAAGKPQLIESDPTRLPKAAKDSGHVAVIVVEVLRSAGAHESAIRFAYENYRLNRADPDAWKAIFAAFMPMLGPTGHVEPTSVSVDSAVLVREGESSQWIVVEPDGAALDHGEYSPEHPFVKAMLGKQVGDTFELQRYPLPPRVYSVAEIRSKYVRCLRHCTQKWEELFPGSPGPQMIDVPEDIEAFSAQLMPMLQERVRQVEELDQLYRDKPCSFHMLGSGLGGSVFATMGHLIAETDIGLRCTRASNQEAARLLEALEAGERVILEATALSTLLMLRESGILSALRPRVAVAQSTIDQLKGHLREVDARGSGWLTCVGGRVTIEVADEAGRAKYRESLTALLALVSSECEVFQESEHNLLTHEEWDNLVRIAGAGAVESLHRALRTNEILWSDDMVVALVAQQRGVRVGWTQLMLHHLVTSNRLELDRGNEATAKLVGWRFVSTQTVPATYLAAARLARWNPEHWPLRQHLQLFKVESWEDRAIVALAANALREWWRNAPSDASGNAVTVALLDRIAARENGPVLIAAIARILERAFGVDVLGYRRARQALDAWFHAQRIKRIA